MSTAHFNRQAADWDNNPVRVENARKIASALRRALPLTKDMSALEFGCGTGLVSRELLPDLGSILAVDLSPGMIEQLNQRIAEDGLQNIAARCLDLLDGPAAGSFDLIFSAMALHHVPETEALLEALITQLKPGGFIAIADLDREDGSFHDESAGPVYNGFDRQMLMQKLCACGCSDAAAVTANTIHKNGRGYPVFLITARRSKAG